mmetsp:Transcript_1630/g.1743  ORF Transcript_1630/g.1743 Transcript_1630/m.1743 type:complete len:121 (+) Transcript_1630:20-382(+)
MFPYCKSLDWNAEHCSEASSPKTATKLPKRNLQQSKTWSVQRKNENLYVRQCILDQSLNISPCSLAGPLRGVLGNDVDDAAPLSIESMLQLPGGIKGVKPGGGRSKDNCMCKAASWFIFL